MSLRWIHENLEPPNCDEECSDIDDSCSDGSLDSDIAPTLATPTPSTRNDDDDSANNNNNNDDEDDTDGGRAKRETRRHPTTTVTIDEFGKQSFKTEESDEKSDEKPCVPWDPRVSANGPAYQSLKLKLFCRTGYFIGITPSGRARGFSADSTNDAHVRLIVCPVSYGVIRLQSAETGHYLAFNATGHLYGETKMNKDNTEWEQWSIGSYDAFRSHKYAESGWWLGIKRNGRHKPGPKTAWGQKATQFLPIRLA